MDKTNEQIINALKQDGQMPFLTIAKKLNLSPETVRQRYKEMVNSQQIKLNSIILDLEKIGFRASVFLFIKGKSNRSRKELLDYLEKIPNIFTITELMGKFDFYASGAVRDLQDFYEMIKKFHEIPAVDHIEFTLGKDLSFAHSKKRENHEPHQIQFWGCR